MGEIQELDIQTINKIAAGEVIERPASVVKELIENALDADASQISVEVTDGGKESIIVSDNGKGMEKDDVLLSIKKHTTSKLKESKDLFTIATLGFRGEALASIASISLLQITSSQQDGLGYTIQCDQGKIVKQEECAATKGTTITVKDLFYNVPVRKRYLKESGYEYRKILQILTRYSLAYPEKHFSLKHNNSFALQAPANDPKNNIVEILGTDIAEALVPVSCSKDTFSMQGFVSKPECSKPDKTFMITFVNGRYIENDELRNLIFQAYYTLLNTQRFPVTVLHFKFPYSMIDVNVHPTKNKIRFRNLELLSPIIIAEIKKAIYGEDLVPGITDKDIEKRQFWQSRSKPKQSSYAPRDAKPSKQETLVKIKDLQIKTGLKEKEKPSEKTLKSEDEQFFNILGILHKTFIVEETQQGLRLIDQHAAHERILFEQVIQKYKNAEIDPQQLLQPLTLELTHEEAALIEQYKEALKELGFTVEHFGQKTYILRSVPNIMGRQLDKDFLFFLLHDFEKIQKDLPLDQKKHEWYARIACRAAEKAGDTLENVEVQKLLKDLFDCEQPHTCPHGRPTMIDLSIHDLEKFFKRVR